MFAQIIRKKRRKEFLKPTTNIQQNSCNLKIEAFITIISNMLPITKCKMKNIINSIMSIIGRKGGELGSIISWGEKRRGGGHVV